MIFLNTFIHCIEFKISDICLTLPVEEIPSLHSIVKANKCLDTEDSYKLSLHSLAGVIT